MAGIVYGKGSNSRIPRIIIGQINDVEDLITVDGLDSPIWNKVVVSDGARNAGVIDKYANLWTWGLNSNGQLGTGDEVDRSAPTEVLANVAMVSMSGGVSMAITNDGGLYVCGYNAGGELGLGDTTNRSTFTRVGTDTWKFVCTVGAKSVAINSDGTLWTWGSSNWYGNLGYNDSFSTKVTSDVPVQIDTSTDWVEAVMTDDTLIVRDENGFLSACGSNSSGQLGISNTTGYRYLRSQPSYIQFRSIGACGSQTSTGIGIDGRWYAWGGYAWEGDPFYNGDLNIRNRPEYGGQASSVMSGHSNWDRCLGDFGSWEWVFLDQDGKIWVAFESFVDDVVKESEQVFTSASLNYSTLLAIDYVASAFWTKFVDQTETDD